MREAARSCEHRPPCGITWFCVGNCPFSVAPLHQTFPQDKARFSVGQAGRTPRIDQISTASGRMRPLPVADGLNSGPDSREGHRPRSRAVTHPGCDASKLAAALPESSIGGPSPHNLTSYAAGRRESRLATVAVDPIAAPHAREAAAGRRGIGGPASAEPLMLRKQSATKQADP